MNMVNRMETSDIINYRANTHIITDYCYDSFGRRIHTVERTKTGMRTIYDGLSFEVVKEREDPHTHELKKRSSEAPIFQKDRCFVYAQMSRILLFKKQINGNGLYMKYLLKRQIHGMSLR